MHPVPADLDLTQLHGAEVIQICIGQLDIQIRFDSGAVVIVESDWELIEEGGEIVDRSAETMNNRPSFLPRLLGRIVSSTIVEPPLSFSLIFTGRICLRVIMNDSPFECCSIQPLGIVL